ncbi:MAG: hypothetical protein PHE21_01965 [Candidatus Dojkabacteria bacterium]|nr:hypothetical protein [Candidatus Dojkabacteria bacterium]
MKGYMALTVVLLIIPLLLLAGIDSVYNNLTSLLVGKMNYDSQKLEINTETCLEESIYRIKRNPNYTGEYTLTIGELNCTVNIQDKDGFAGEKFINISSTDVNGISVEITKELNTNVNPYTVKNI